MKQKYTKARKARRASGFLKAHGSTSSKKRMEKRAALQASEPKTKGYQVTRIQRIFYREDMFGNKAYKLIPHARSERNPALQQAAEV